MFLAEAIFVLTHSIAKREGFYVHGSLPQRLNNPCALVYAGQLAAVAHHSGFAKFPTPTDGWFACERDIRKKMSRGSSLHRAWRYLR